MHVSIGQTLARAREQAGLSVDDVAAATRVRRTLVSKIEQNDFALCGGDFYARGHLRNIAAAVGVDPAPLLAEYDRTYAESAAPRASTVFESETSARPERRGPNWTAAMAAALVLVVAYGLVNVFTGGENEPVTTAEREGGRSSTAAAPSPSASRLPSPTESAIAGAKRDKVTVVLRAKGTSWVQATNADGKEIFQGLVQDRSETFTDRHLVRLVVGNAGAVDLTVNGRSIGAPGKPGQVARVEFTRDDPATG